MALTPVGLPIVGAYSAPINIRQSATSAAATTVWYLNSVLANAKKLLIRRIVATVGFDGTAATATQRYDVMRYGTAVCSAGTAITIAKKNSSYAASGATAGFLDTGVTVTSVVFEAAFATLGTPIGVTGRNSVYPMEFTTPGQTYGEFVIRPGEGLAIQVSTVAAVIGQTIGGYVEWDEA